MPGGLIDADLGGKVYKKRVALPGRRHRNSRGSRSTRAVLACTGRCWMRTPTKHRRAGRQAQIQRKAPRARHWTHYFTSTYVPLPPP